MGLLEDSTQPLDMAAISPDSLSFLADLAANNHRDWFAANRPRYDAANANAKAFLEHVVTRMNEGDDITKSKLFRVYRDVRFSKDKTPYNPHFGMSMGRRKPELRGGYYIDIRPDESTIWAGFFGPVSADLALIRSAIDEDGDHFRHLVEDPQLVSIMGAMQGKKVKTAPRGYRKDHPHIDLLRHKQFLYSRSFSRDETLDPDFAEEIVFSYRSVLSFFSYMSEILVGPG